MIMSKNISKVDIKLYFKKAYVFFTLVKINVGGAEHMYLILLLL